MRNAFSGFLVSLLSSSDSLWVGANGPAPIVQHAKEVLVSGQRKNPEHSAQVLREA